MATLRVRLKQISTGMRLSMRIVKYALALKNFAFKGSSRSSRCALSNSVAQLVSGEKKPELSL
jgi:hypothetical protein